MKLQTIKNISKKGFTLIELLVVITIIGILATGATSTYTSQIQKARDTTRINDVKAIQSACEQVYQDAMEYPAATLAGFAAVQDYLDKYPEDSKHIKPGNIKGIATLTATDSQLLGYTYNMGVDENGISGGNFEVSTGFEATGNITGKATTDGLGALNQDANRLEIGTASKTLGLGTVLKGTSGSVTADGPNASCLITSAAGCTPY